MNSSDNQQKKSRFNWGTGLTIGIIFFMSLTLGMVIYVSNIDFQLVTKDYYPKAEKYQEHIDEVKHAEALDSPVTINVLGPKNEIQIQFPSSINQDSLSGSIHLYRPSNSDQDRTVKIALNNSGIQRIDATKLSKGKWEVKLSWTAGDKRYFKQQNIFL